MVKKVKFLKERKITMSFLKREQENAFENNNMPLLKLISNLIKLRKKQKLYKHNKTKLTYEKK